MALTLSDPASTLYDQAAKWLSEDDPSNLELWLDEMTVLPNTSTTSASAALEKMGKRVLLIDDRRPTNLPAEFVVLFRSRPNVIRVTFKAAQSLSNKVGLDVWVGERAVGYRYAGRALKRNGWEWKRLRNHMYTRLLSDDPERCTHTLKDAHFTWSLQAHTVVTRAHSIYLRPVAYLCIRVTPDTLQPFACTHAHMHTYPLPPFPQLLALSHSPPLPHSRTPG